LQLSYGVVGRVGLSTVEVDMKSSGRSSRRVEHDIFGKVVCLIEESRENGNGLRATA
jgi:hypothetical protein